MLSVVRDVSAVVGVPANNIETRLVVPPQSCLHADSYSIFITPANYVRLLL